MVGWFYKSNVLLVLGLGSAVMAEEAADSLGTEFLAVEQEGLGQEYAVDLSGDELPSIIEKEQPTDHVLAKPWYQKIDISGFGAAGFLDSDEQGSQPNGGFAVTETAVFLEAEAWENMSIYFEIQVNPRLQDDRGSFRTGEVYAHFRDVWTSASGDYLGLKVGRFDIPFGEEYLQQDAADNPLVSQGVSFAWLWDEGIAAYGRLSGINWVAAVTDGSMSRSVDENLSKALNGKVYGNPWENLYLSASVMKNDDTSGSALYLGETCFQPVGAKIHGRDVASSQGASASGKVDALLYELDTKLSGPRGSELLLVAGQAQVNDDDDAFDRQLQWFVAQARVNLPVEKTYAALRYSEFGTRDADQGYQIGGGFLTNGRQTFGYDTKRLQRLSLGLGWQINPKAALKLEAGGDRFELVDGSPLDPEDGNGNFTAAELVLSF